MTRPGGKDWWAHIVSPFCLVAARRKIGENCGRKCTRVLCYDVAGRGTIPFQHPFSVTGSVKSTSQCRGRCVAPFITCRLQHPYGVWKQTIPRPNFTPTRPSTTFVVLSDAVRPLQSGLRCETFAHHNISSIIRARRKLLQKDATIMFSVFRMIFYLRVLDLNKISS